MAKGKIGNLKISSVLGPNKTIDGQRHEQKRFVPFPTVAEDCSIDDALLTLKDWAKAASDFDASGMVKGLRVKGEVKDVKVGYKMLGSTRSLTGASIIECLKRGLALQHSPELQAKNAPFHKNPKAAKSSAGATDEGIDDVGELS